jgi:hypothetical protein
MLAERTLWDKIYIRDGIYHAHEAGTLKIDGTDRKSRHHYDVVLMHDTDVGKAAIRTRNWPRR